MRRLAATLAACLLPLTAAASSPAGDWVGVYNCAQGVTDLDLRIEDSSGALQALFHFTPDPSNPSVPEGCFVMQGSYNPQTGSLVLQPGAWRMRPLLYVMVGMTGTLNQSGSIISGRISGPGCANFILTKTATAPSRTAPCTF